MPGVLKAKVGGSWVDIGVGNVDEVYVGDNEPTDQNIQLWYDTDAVTPTPALVQTATYTPTLASLAIGTGGSAQNTADYTYVGGAGVGARGWMTAVGRIVFGTSGTTFPSSTSRIGLPPGFNIFPLGTTWHIGAVRGVNPGFAGYDGVLATDTALPASMQFYFAQLVAAAVGSGIYQAVVTGTFPFTWAAGTEVRWHLNTSVVRV